MYKSIERVNNERIDYPDPDKSFFELAEVRMIFNIKGEEVEIYARRFNRDKEIELEVFQECNQKGEADCIWCGWNKNEEYVFMRLYDIYSSNEIDDLAHNIEKFIISNDFVLKVIEPECHCSNYGTLHNNNCEWNNWKNP